MRLASCHDDGLRPGLAIGEELPDLTDAVIGLPADTAARLALGPDGLESVGRLSKPVVDEPAIGAGPVP